MTVYVVLATASDGEHINAIFGDREAAEEHAEGRRLDPDTTWSYEVQAWSVGGVSETEPHEPGDHHRYELKCVVCGQLGTIRLSIDPETVAASPRASEEGRETG